MNGRKLINTPPATRLIDANVEPAKEVQVNLVAGDDGDKDWWTWTNNEGYDYKSKETLKRKPPE